MELLKQILFFLQGRNVIVFYGSQTGTAEEFAGRLAKDAQGYGMKGMVADPEECEMVMSSLMLDYCESVVVSMFIQSNFNPIPELQ